MSSGEGPVPEPRERGRRQDDITNRLTELDSRIAELRSLRAELRDNLPGSGTSADRLTWARDHQHDAHARLLNSLQSFIYALRLSGVAHNRAAESHEHLAQAGVGDVGWHEREAANHRAAALLDEATADHAAGAPVAW